jgi:GAF domain-containing protein
MKSTDRILSAYLGIVPRTPEAAVLRLLVELGVECMGADEGSLLVLDRKKKQLVFAMTVGSAASERTLVGQGVPLGAGLTGLAAATREVQIGAPTFKDIKQRQRAKAPGGHPAAVLAAPLLIRDEVVGVITAASFDPHKRFSAAGASLYAKIASVAAVVVDQQQRLRAVEGLRRGRARLKAISDEERLRREIVDRVGDLTRRRPDRLPDIRLLLKTVGSLCDR